MVKRVKPSLSLHDVARLCDEHEKLTSDLARVTAERDAALADVEAMRAVCEAASNVGRGSVNLRILGDALDALRARKVGR